MTQPLQCSEARRRLMDMFELCVLFLEKLPRVGCHSMPHTATHIAGEVGEVKGGNGVTGSGLGSWWLDGGIHRVTSGMSGCGNPIKSEIAVDWMLMTTTSLAKTFSFSSKKDQLQIKRVSLQVQSSPSSYSPQHELCQQFLFSFGQACEYQLSTTRKVTTSKDIHQRFNVFQTVMVNVF